MKTKTQTIIEYASQLNLSSFKDQLEEVIKHADQTKCSYSDFALSLLQVEIDHRVHRDLERRIKTAWLPLNHNIIKKFNVKLKVSVYL